MDLQARRDRSRGSVTPLIAVMVAGACALALVLTLWAVLSASGDAPARQRPTADPAAGQLAPDRPGTRSFTLLQLNLCLSGVASCHGWAYPAVLREAIARIRATGPDAVTLNEGCGRDARYLARATGYRLRFVPIDYAGGSFPCIRPGGRGLFGDAVLTRARVVSSSTQPFRAQEGPEVRRWLCVVVRRGPDVCTAHLEVTGIGAGRPNAAQCAELGRVLTRRAAEGTVVFGGDVNRTTTCAPAGFWTATDRGATQGAGLQQVYGTASNLGPPESATLPARYTDHDALVVRALVRTGPGGG